MDRPTHKHTLHISNSQRVRELFLLLCLRICVVDSCPPTMQREQGNWALPFIQSHSLVHTPPCLANHAVVVSHSLVSPASPLLIDNAIAPARCTTLCEHTSGLSRFTMETPRLLPRNQECAKRGIDNPLSNSFVPFFPTILFASFKRISPAKRRGKILLAINS